MEFVEPIRDRKQLEAMKKYLRGTSLRDHALFVLGINSGLRVSDLLNLTVGDVTDSRGRIRERMVVTEQKTGKRKSFAVGVSVTKAIAEFLATRPDATDDEPLFASRKGGALKRARAWEILNGAARAVGIKDKIGTHTMRKTFGYHAYRDGKDLALIMQLLNHSSPSHTLRYIGASQDEMDRVYLTLNL
ncbi:site-specific integrase [Alicyclobacillus ferrooxydans]|uniref:Integrase n=1 Tax=Alicyclobacillus ferrooxydans TaxID=471514 RepID=A0A0P9EPS1_9BACL|nr:site-specific integrase [Alicyclobacillus ferrooxydans]KPV45499.1 integrase [Alicyclobacillus ferrooxydans]